MASYKQEEWEKLNNIDQTFLDRHTTKGRKKERSEAEVLQQLNEAKITTSLQEE